MKKLLALLLALSMVLGLAACASQEDKAFEEANALLEAGDYDGAIAAFSAIGRYQEISAKIDEAIQLRNEVNAGFLIGTWKDINTETTITLSGEGKGNVSGEEGTDSVTYTYTDGFVFIEGTNSYGLDVVETDGILHLTDGFHDLVAEANYAALAPVEIEITMENWEEYFELREANNVYINQFGDTESNLPGYGIFLKEELYDRVKNTYDAINVDFEITYDEVCCKVLGYEKDAFDYNFVGDYTLEPCKAPSWWETESGCTVTASVYDNRDYPDGSDADPYYQKIAAQFYFAGAFAEMGSTMYYNSFENVAVTRAQGSITLLP